MLNEYKLTQVGYYLDGGSKSLAFQNESGDIKKIFFNNSLSEPEKKGKYFISGKNGHELNCIETIHFIEEEIKKYESF